MANLLDEASILLTPTAYDNGKVLCVKPSAAPYGDFDFSRNSSATRVNAQGLVEDVQILSGNLVTNGDFSQEGSELVTGGDFSNPSDWTLQANASIGNNELTFNGSSNTVYALQNLYSSGLYNGKALRFTYEIISNTLVGGGNFRGGGITGGSLFPSANLELNSTVGIHTVDIVINSTGINSALDIFITAPYTSGSLVIDNVSVKEVGQDWTFSTGVTISGGKANFANVASNSNGIYQSSVLQSNKNYRIEFTISNYSSGNITAWSGGSQNIGDNDTFNSNGTKVLYLNSSSTNGILLISTYNQVGNFSITNISAIEVTDDTNLPRINYDGFSFDGSGAIIPNSGCGSWLFEPQSTNLITYSEDFSDASWTKSGASVVSGFVSPSAELNAFKLVEDSISSSKSIKTSNFSVVNGQEYTISIFAKPNGRFLQITPSVAFVQSYINYDLNNGTMDLSGSGSASGTITLLSNGYYRCTYTAAANASSTIASIFSCLVNSISATRKPSYQGDGTSGIYIYGFQIEQQSYATSYIPTEGTTVTRNQDVCNNGGSAALINSTEGVLYADIQPITDNYINNVGVTITSQFNLSDGNLNNGVNIRFRGTILQCLYYNGLGYEAVLTYNNISVSETYKVAFLYKQNDFKMYVNGVLISSDTNGSIGSFTLDRLTFDNSNNVNPFYGKTKCLAVWKTALTDTELAELTTI